MKKWDMVAFVGVGTVVIALGAWWLLAIFIPRVLEGIALGLLQ